jgi:hypothetical protein
MFARCAEKHSRAIKDAGLAHHDIVPRDVAEKHTQK